MGEITTKLLVLGGGPGGYVAAIRAGQHGIDTVLVEENRLGGTCLNVGCIPSKAMIHAAEAYHAAVLHAGEASPFGLSAGPPTLDFPRTIAWKDGIVGRLNTGVASLLKRGGVKILRGRGTMVDGKTCLVETDTGPERVRADHVILATGSVPAALPHLPFGGRVISSTEALSLQKVPATMAVVGAGYIGLELGTAFAKLGAKVTVVEMAERILPAYDAELTRPVARRLGALGIEVLLGAKATGLSGDALDIEVGGEPRKIPAEVILVAVGRKARTQDFGLDRLDLDMSGPFIRIDERCATSMRNVWAVGDVTGEPMLAHRAMAQGEMVADLVAGRRRAFHKVAIPAVCFTDPEVVSAGLSPEEARAAGHEIRTGLFPFAANGRAMTLGAEDGFVRVTARADNHLLLGIQAVGAGVSELAAGFGLALEMGARLEDIAGTIHAHPTLGEAFHEANLRALGEALHI
ncbi:dihydrolipoyl dehydrogenase [Methylobacterium sp. DB0501]|uniref:dihydrolipoyl dehydrogenase n=1 Tax=Methylobacterium sp. DB0501 TaxID=2709665 RepID=UPI0013EB5C7B|nr:dihydrolipoyl dehydrogenase [Methylobacterium sp. DB0501]NGM36044.1 dihydrolipoyl dehydrogenase [Methylobacterium sp. DB0501]